MQNIENKNSYNDSDIVRYHVDDHLLKKLGLLDVGLPHGYCLIGGAARSVAFGCLHPENNPPAIRDLDIGYIMSEDPDLTRYDEISAKYMSDDYEHGYGAQRICSVEDYMNSRDFTMNQAILQGDQLTITKRAIKDIERGELRFAEYGDVWNPEHTYDHKFVSDRLLIKAQLQKAVLENQGYKVKMDKEAPMRESNNYFQLALFIQKACEYGGDIPDKFIENLRNTGTFSEADLSGNLVTIMKRINDEMLDWPFDWRNEAEAWLAVHGSDGQSDVSDSQWVNEIEEIGSYEQLIEKHKKAVRGMSGLSAKLAAEELARY